jgi:hypothetical protein
MGKPQLFGHDATDRRYSRAGASWRVTLIFLPNRIYLKQSHLVSGGFFRFN